MWVFLSNAIIQIGDKDDYHDLVAFFDSIPDLKGYTAVGYLDFRTIDDFACILEHELTLAVRCPNITRQNLYFYVDPVWNEINHGNVFKSDGTSNFDPQTNEKSLALLQTEKIPKYRALRWMFWTLEFPYCDRPRDDMEAMICVETMRQLAVLVEERYEIANKRAIEIDVMTL